MKKKKNRVSNTGSKTTGSKIAYFSLQSFAAIVLCSLLLIGVVAQSSAAIQDTTPPSVTITNPSGYQSFEVGKFITLGGTASDDSGIKIVEANLAGGPYQAATGTQSWEVQVPIPADFPLGGNTVVVRATDSNGNFGYSYKNIDIASAVTTTTTTAATAFSATGSNFYDIPDNAALRLGTFSLGAWFKTTMTIPDQTAIIAGKGGFGSESAGDNMNYGIWLDQNENIVAGFEDTNGINQFIRAKQQFNDNLWHYAVVTYDGQLMRLYVDGQYIGTLATDVKPDEGTKPLRIGGNSLQDNRYFVGQIDEVRIWNRSLPGSEVSTQFATDTFDSNGLLAYMDGSSYVTYYSGGISTNSPPVADAGQDKTAFENTIVSLDGSSSFDPDGDVITYSWKQVSGPAVTLSNPTSSKPSFTAPNLSYGSATTIIFSLTVSDGSDSSSDTIAVTDTSLDTQAPTGSLKINSGDLYTKVSSVTLTLSCSDTESSCGQMKISVDGTFDSEVYETFATSKSVTLSSGNGLKTVKAMFKDSSGNASPVYSDSITLDSIAPTSPVITSPKTGTTTTNTKPTFSGSAEASSTVTVYYTTSSSTTVSIGTVKASSTGTWSVIPSSNMASGIYNVQAKATDAAGNVSPASAVVKVTISTTTTSTSTGYTYTVCASGCTYNSLQTAVNSLPSSGGSILVKDGKYSWSNTVSLRSNTNVVFSSGAYITFTSGDRPALKGSNVNNVSIKGGSITALYSGVKAIAFYDSNGIHVNGTKAVLVQGNNANGFYCQDCIDVYVSNMNIKTATRGIDIKTSTRDASSGLTRNVWVQNNVVDDTAVEGIKINWCKDVHIIGNKISNTSNNGIDIGFNINSEVISNSIYKTGVDGEGIHTDSTDTALVKNNYVSNTGSTGITVYRATKVDVIGNTVVDATKNGINIIDTSQPSSYVTVKNNIVKSAGLDGIYESPSQYQVEIAYNTVSQVASGYQGVRVIWSDNATTSVHDNTVT